MLDLILSFIKLPQVNTKMCTQNSQYVCLLVCQYHLALSAIQSVYQSISISCLSQSVSPFVCLSVSLSIYLYIYLSGCLSIYPSIHSMELCCSNIIMLWY